MTTTYELQNLDGKRLARFTSNREIATSRDDIELLGLDHRLMQDELGRWRSLPPEEIGIAVHEVVLTRRFCCRSGSLKARRESESAGSAFKSSL